MIARAQSSSPSAPSLSRTARCRRRHTPAWVHSWNRRCAVGTLTPNDGGSCRHEHPAGQHEHDRCEHRTVTSPATPTTLPTPAAAVLQWPTTHPAPTDATDHPQMIIMPVPTHHLSKHPLNTGERRAFRPESGRHSPTLKAIYCERPGTGSGSTHHTSSARFWKLPAEPATPAVIALQHKATCASHQNHANKGRDKPNPRRIAINCSRVAFPASR